MPHSSQEITVFTQEVGGGEPIAEFGNVDVEFGYRLNRAGYAEVTIPRDHKSLSRSNIAPQEHELAVKVNGVIQWVGPVLTVDEGMDAVTFGCEGLMNYLKRWHVTTKEEFNSVDQFTIARSLIDHHQNKGPLFDVGIVTDGSAINNSSPSGSGGSGVTRTRTYESWDLKNIYDAVVQLSEVNNGFDFQFEPSSREFRLYYPKKGRRRENAVFDLRNIKSFERRIDGTGLGNQVFGVGSGEETNMLIEQADSNPSQQKFNVHQQIVTHKDISNSATLLAHAESARDAWSNFPNLITIGVNTHDPQLYTYFVGDEVRVLWPSEYERVAEFQRLVGIDVKSVDGVLTAGLSLNPII